MSEDPKPPSDPRGAPPFVRRKVGPAKVALAFVLAVLITAVIFGTLALILWGLRLLFH